MVSLASQRHDGPPSNLSLASQPDPSTAKFVQLIAQALWPGEAGSADALAVAVAHLSQLARFRLHLLQPETHVHLTVHRRCGGDVLSGLLSDADTLKQLAEP